MLKSRNKSLDSALEVHTTKMSELTVAIVRLETKIENIENLALSIPKIKEDLNALHNKVRASQPIAL